MKRLISFAASFFLLMCAIGVVYTGMNHLWRQFAVTTALTVACVIGVSYGFKR